MFIKCEWHLYQYFFLGLFFFFSEGEQGSYQGCAWHDNHICTFVLLQPISTDKIRPSDYSYHFGNVFEFV